MPNSFLLPDWINEIYLNVTHLTKGSYKLKIVHKSKVIKTINFKKDD